MSYPSINTHLEAQGATLDTATEIQMEKAFLGAFYEDLSLGMAKVEELVDKMKNKNDRVMLSLPPNSAEGKQFARLLGPDVPRQVLENHFGVAFGFYNCCSGLVAPTREQLKITMREQIESQHPDFVDC
ncbi:MAG TPA: hypothetical protein VGF14_05940 [Alphaproteobacteria bacterium]